MENKIAYNGYTIIPMEIDTRTVYDDYLGDGHTYRETFKSVDEAKSYINQPKF